jgi:hypothetical protein
MKFAVVMEVYDSSGGSEDKEREIVDATPDVVTERFNRIDWRHPSDWRHPTNRYHLTLTRGDLNSPDRKQLSINEDLPEGSEQTVLIAKLVETPQGGSQQKYYDSPPLESPDIALKLLQSFLAQDGSYRTLVDWQER